MQEKNLKLVDKIMTALQKVEDPELLVDVVNLGLIYGIDIEGDHATIKMTLTIVGCPLSTIYKMQLKRQFCQSLRLKLAMSNWFGIQFGVQKE